MLQFTKILNLCRARNFREGFDRKNNEYLRYCLSRGIGKTMDYYGKRLLSNDIHEILDEYYDERGWELDKGITTRRSWDLKRWQIT